jgi:hypothetical protein
MVDDMHPYFVWKSQPAVKPFSLFDLSRVVGLFCTAPHRYDVVTFSARRRIVMMSSPNTCFLPTTIARQLDKSFICRVAWLMSRARQMYMNEDARLRARIRERTQLKAGTGWIKKRRKTVVDLEPMISPTKMLPSMGETRRLGHTMDGLHGVHVYMVEGNQYMVGATQACASISFQAAFYMTRIPTIKDVVETVDWEGKVLVRGKQLWTAWKRLTGRPDTYQSIDDIIKIPNIDGLLEFMGPRTEFYGPLYRLREDKYDELVDKLVTREMDRDDVMRTLLVRLPAALKAMTAKARQPGQTHSVALIFSSGATISTYAHANGEFVIYDSHGTLVSNGYSSLFRCADVTVAVAMMRHILASYAKSAASRPWEETASLLGANKSYNICIFSSQEGST